MENPDFIAREERKKFERKQKQRLKGKSPKDDGSNWRLEKYFEECR